MTFGKRAEASFYFRREFGDLRGRVAKKLAQFVIVLFLTNPTAKGFDKRQVRSRRFVLVTAAAQDQRAVNRCLNRYLTRETRFPRAWFAAQKHCVTASFTRALPEFARFRELVRAADEASA